MCRKNTLSKKSYLFDCLYGTLIAYMCYKVYLFRSLPGLPRVESVMILWTLILLCMASGIILTWKRGRTNLSSLVNVCFPFGIYTVISYFSVFPALIGTLSVVALVLTALYCGIIIFRKVDSQSPKRILRLKATYCLFGSKSILSLVSSAICLILTFNIIFGNSLIPPTVSPEVPSKDEKWTITENMDTVMKLQDDEWSKLSVEEKLNTMQIIANIEAQYLGITHELNVAIEPLGAYTIGHYRDGDHTIVFNIDYFEHDNPREVVDTLCHEAYHAYQHRLCDAYDSTDERYHSLLLFHNVQKYKEEFADYKSGSKDFGEYYTQKCESSARAYGLSGSSAYFDAIAMETGTFDESEEEQSSQPTPD